MIGPLLRVAASAAAARSLRNAAHDVATRAKEGRNEVGGMKDIKGARHEFGGEGIALDAMMGGRPERGSLKTPRQ